MHISACSSDLGYARDRARELQAQAAAERTRAALAPRRTMALLLRRAADRLDPAPLAPTPLRAVRGASQ